MDEQENKADILSEIFDKSEESSPAQKRPKFEYPPDSESFPAPPQNKPGEKSSTAAKLLPWLCMVLGAALLVLGICLLQLVRMNSRLDSLEETIQSVALIDQIQRDNKILQQEQEKLEQSAQQAEWRTRDVERAYQELNELYYAERNRNQLMNRLWYLQSFMEAGDYPMAAALVKFSTGTYDPNEEYNEALLEQYRTYAQELVDRGYLEETPELAAMSEALSFPLLAFTEQWDPGKHHDMAAMSILWCALDAHFITRAEEGAAQYLFLYPLGDPDSDYMDRVNRLASPFTLKQFEIMKQDLIESKNLIVTDDGGMEEGTGSGFSLDVLYNLPFDLPPS